MTRQGDTSFSQTIKFWDARNGFRVATPEEPDAKVTASAFSPDGRRIVSFFALGVPRAGMTFDDSVSIDRTLKIWDAGSGTELVSTKGHERGAMACAYSPDGTRILACHGETLKIWDARTGAELTTLKGHANLVNAGAFSPDGGLIISASSDGTLRIWDARTGAELDCLEHTGEVFTCAFSMDGQLIKSGSGNEIIIWDARERVELARYVVSGLMAGASSQDGLLTVAVTVHGEALVLKLDNVESSPPVITAWTHPELALGCPLCRNWSGIPETALGSVIGCPVCRSDLRLNSIALAADWRPIAAAWGRDFDRA
jgi:WD40 repeat protein